MISTFAPAFLFLITGASPTGQIAFVSGTEQEDQCVCLLDLRTEKITPLGPGRRDGAPVWSPDGQWLAFESDVPEQGIGIHIVRPDGTGLRALDHQRESNHRPRWSGDSRRLAYSAAGFGGEIRVYDVQSNTEIAWGGGAVGLLRPVWRDVTSLYAIQVMPAQDGQKRPMRIVLVTESGVSPLNINAQTYQGPSAPWAVEPQPGGSAIVFESIEGGNRDIVLRNAEGEVRVLAGNPAADWNPAWSPDGQSLAFESFRGGRRGVYVAFPAADSATAVAVSADYDNWHPAWSPDEEWLAFVSDRTGNPELFVSDTQGKTAVRQLTSNMVNDYAPAWRPGTKP